MWHPRLFGYLFFVFALAQSSVVQAAGGVSPETPIIWKVGDSWELQVEAYARDQVGLQTPPSKPPARYSIIVRVAGSEKSDGLDYWQVDFSPLDAALSEGKESHRVLIRQKDGWPCRILRQGESLGTLFDDIDGLPVITGAPLGLPAELFPLAKTASSKLGGFRLSLRLIKREHQDVQVQEAFVSRGDRHEVVVKQVWRKGEKFWREYERHYKGRLDLRAKVAASSIASLADGSSDNHDGDIVGADPFGLRTDPRLRKRMTVKLTSPNLPTILAHLERAAGVNMTSEESMASSTPIMGSVVWHNVQTYDIMTQIAQADSVQGRWEKVGDGYRLMAGPHSVNAAESDNSAGGNLIVFAVGIGGAVVVGLYLLRYMSRRKQKQAQGV